MKQGTLTDIQYSGRKKKTRREEFLEIMDEIIPWDEWTSVIEPYYPKEKRGRPPMGIEKMLRMYLLQIWFDLSDPATEDAVYDSYAMRKFTGIDFMKESVPDETTLCKFRHLLEVNGLNKLFFEAINRVMVQSGDGFYALVIGRIASISASLYYGRVQQTGSCITVYLLKGVHKSIHPPSFQNCLSLGFSGLLPVSFPAFSLDSRISFHQSFRQTLYAHSYYQKHSQ